MTQNQSQQPSKIVMLAPVAIVLAAYSFMFFSPQQSKLQGAQRRFDSLSATHHETEHEITSIRIESNRVKKEIRQLGDQIHDFQHARDELLGQQDQMRHQLDSHSLPAATMQRVTGLMEKHRLRVLESQQDSSAARQAERTLKSVRDLLKDDKSPANHTTHHNSHHGHTHHPKHEHHTSAFPHHSHFTREVYKLKVRGRFQDLKAALQSLAEELEHVLPLSIQMEPMELDSNEARQSERIWTLAILV